MSIFSGLYQDKAYVQVRIHNDGTLLCDGYTGLNGIGACIVTPVKAVCFDICAFYTYSGYAYCKCQNNVCDDGSGTISVELCLEYCGEGTDKLSKPIDGNSSLLPLYFELQQNYPNPFNPATQINYSLASDGPVRIVVFDAMGNEIETLVDKTEKTGNYSVTFDGQNLSSGIYFYRMTAGSYIVTKKMLLIK